MRIREFIRNNREGIYRKLFLIVNLMKAVREWLETLFGLIFLLTSILFTLTFIYSIGFSAETETMNTLIITFQHILIILSAAKFLPEFLYLKLRVFLSTVFRSALLIAVLAVLHVILIRLRTDGPVHGDFNGNEVVIATIFMIIVSEASRISSFINSIKITPAMIFSSYVIL